jgi:hypothetical protein
MVAQTEAADNVVEHPMASSVTARVELITPAIADRWLKVGAYEHQRRISDVEVRELTAEMQRGRFQKGTSVALAEIKGRYFLVNGQHTLSAIVRSGIDIPLTVQRFTCQNMGEVGRVYSRLDIQRKRSPAARLMALGLGKELALGDRDITALNAAVKLLNLNFRAVNAGASSMGPDIFGILRSADVWAEGLRRYGTAIESYLACISVAETGDIKRKFLRAGIASVALATIDAGARAATRGKTGEATAFWRAAVADDMLGQKDPAHKLHLWVMRLSRTGLRVTEVAGFTANAWNAGDASFTV